MATDNEPMSEKRLAEIKVRIAALSGLSASDPVESYEMYAMGMDLLELVHHLRAEVERLRISRAKVTEKYNHLEDENVAMRTIVEAVAAQGDEVFVCVTDEHGEVTDDVCVYCARSLWCDNDPEHPSHTADCPVTKARALLAVEASNDE